MSQDANLQQAVLSELAWEPSVTAAHIGVTAKAGVVTLTGHVESFVEKHAAESAARRVKGVKAVAEEIEVRLSFDRKRGDDDIAAAAIERLSWDVSVPADAVKVSVEQGWVTLAGAVDWHYQRAAAEQDVRGLHGVVGVSNQMEIKPRVDAANVDDAIRRAMHRSWYFDPDAVKVTAVGGKVRLTGTVHSWHERELATTTAWAAPGATSVENDIVVI
ncbi:MAG: BON domain-containing protein [Roseiarcus sp.]|jgi:osmotically-inducible protein OsmY